MTAMFSGNYEGCALIAALALSLVLTLLAKTAPVTLLKGDSLPQMLRRWLDFVPVAVMAALVGPDIFFYEGKFNVSTANLFLLVSLPTMFIAWKFKNYFATIAVGIGLVVLARYFGMS